MKKLFLFLAAFFVATAMFAEGTESLNNMPSPSQDEQYLPTYSFSFTGDNGQQWSAVGALSNSRVGGYRALAVLATVNNNGLVGNLSSAQVSQGVGTVTFTVRGVRSGTGFGDRTFRVIAGGKSVDVTESMKTYTETHTLSAKIDVTGAKTITITSLPSSSDETAWFYIYNISWTSFSGKTDTPTFSTKDDYIAGGTNTTYYSESNITVNLSCTMSGADIYYTVDGGNPTTSSTKGNTVSLGKGTHTVRAIAVTSSNGTSEVATKVYKVATGRITRYDGGSNDGLEGNYNTTNSADNMTSPSDFPMYRLTGSQNNLVSRGVAHPLGVSIYAYTPNNKTVTVAYQEGSYASDNTWNASGDWKDLQSFTPSSPALGRYEIKLPAFTDNQTVRFRVLASGNTVYIDDFHIISEMINQAAAPTISPASGEVKKGTTVTITPASGTTLHYSVNGGAEQTSTKAVSVTINEPTTVTAYDTQSGYAQSVTVSASYTVEEVQPSLTAPVISPNGGNLQWGTEVSITAANSQETIHYSVGSEAEKTAAGSVKIKLTEDCTISAYSTRTGYKQSETVNATFTVYKPGLAEPQFSLQGGEVLYGTEVTISVPQGISIVYTINGGQQQTATTTQTIAITENMTITAQAVAEGYTDSKQVSATFTVVYPQAEAPLFSLEESEVEKGTELKIKGQKGDKVWYSINGGEWSFAITEAIVVINEDMEIKAYSTRENHTDSEIVSAIFIIKTPTDLEQSNLEQGIRSNEQGHVRKVFENGQIYILLPDGRKINTLGVEMR